MSLRFFHIFFIMLAALMSFLCAGIEYSNYGDQHSSLHLGFSIFAAVAGVALLVYAVFFYKKTKKLML